MSSDNTLTKTNSGGVVVLPDDYRIIDYEFPPTNYQAAPQPTEDTEDSSATATPMSAADRLAFTPKPGVLIWDTTIGMLFVGDGVTPGGIVVEGGGSGGDFTRVVFHDPAN